VVDILDCISDPALNFGVDSGQLCADVGGLPSTTFQVRYLGGNLEADEEVVAT
jgi:hypothetical protein